MFGDREDSLRTKIVVKVSLAVLYLVYILFRYFTYDPLVLKNDGADLGTWVTEGERLHAFESDDRDIGKHFLLTCSLENAGIKNRHGYGYYPVKDVSGRTTNSKGVSQRVYLLSEEELPVHQYMELDTLVVGYYKTTNQFKQEISTPVVSVVGVRQEGTFEELAAPLLSTAEPGVSVCRDGVTVTLERVEYRRGVTQAFFTLENGNDFSLVNYDTSFSSEGERISGTSVGNVYTTPLAIRNYAENMKQKLPLYRLKAHQSCSCSLLLLPVDPAAPLDLTASLRYYSSVEKLETLEMDNIDVQLTWQPDSGAPATS